MLGAVWHFPWVTAVDWKYVLVSAESLLRFCCCHVSGGGPELGVLVRMCVCSGFVWCVRVVDKCSWYWTYIKIGCYGEEEWIISFSYLCIWLRCLLFVSEDREVDHVFLNWKETWCVVTELGGKKNHKKAEDCLKTCITIHIQSLKTGLTPCLFTDGISRNQILKPHGGLNKVRKISLAIGDYFSCLLFSIILTLDYAELGQTQKGVILQYITGIA